MTDTTTHIPRRAFTLNEVAAQFGLSLYSIKQLILKGQLRTVKTGKSYLVPATEVDRFLNGTPIAD